MLGRLLPTDRDGLALFLLDKLVALGRLERVERAGADGRGRSLMNPDEIMRMPRDALLPLHQGERSLMVSKVRHHDGCEFAGLFDPA